MPFSPFNGVGNYTQMVFDKGLSTLFLELTMKKISQAPQQPGPVLCYLYVVRKIFLTSNLSLTENNANYYFCPIPMTDAINFKCQQGTVIVSVTLPLFRTQQTQLLNCLPIGPDFQFFYFSLLESLQFVLVFRPK